LLANLHAEDAMDLAERSGFAFPMDEQYQAALTQLLADGEEGVDTEQEEEVEEWREWSGTRPLEKNRISAKKAALRDIGLGGNIRRAKCGAVDCAEKYLGAKDGLDAKTGRCEATSDCFSGYQSQKGYVENCTKISLTLSY